MISRERFDQYGLHISIVKKKAGKPKLPAEPFQSSHSRRAITGRTLCALYKAVQTDFTSVYSSSESWPISRPQPDCLYPPKGRAASNTL